MTMATRQIMIDREDYVTLTDAARAYLAMERERRRAFRVPGPEPNFLKRVDVLVEKHMAKRRIAGL